MTWRIEHGDCLDVMRGMPDASVDAIVTDPPYGLAFMGKQWDHGVPGVPFWTEALRVAKPGAHLLAFGGTRTFHRLAVAIEDAGWEVRDCLSWLYGSGFPKSLDVSKAMDKRRDDTSDILRVTAFIRAGRDRSGVSNARIDALFGMNGMSGHWTSSTSQPSVPTPEQWPRLKAFLGLDDSMDAEVVRLNERKGEHGEAWKSAEVVGRREDGAGNGSVVGLGSERSMSTAFDVKAPNTDLAKQWEGWGTALKPAWEPIIVARKPLVGTVARNVTEFGTGALNIDGCRIGMSTADESRLTDWHGRYGGRDYATGQVLGFNNGDAHRQVSPPHALGRWPANVMLDEDAAAALDAQTGTLTSGLLRAGTKRTTDGGYRGGFPEIATHRDTGGDSGGASRFFYVAKASRSEREAGLREAGLREAETQRYGEQGQGPDPKQTPREPVKQRNTHPTVKPVALMRWLCRLVTPPGGVVLDPFCGSGTTGVAAVREGFRFVGIEREAEYVEIARARVAHAAQGQVSLPGTEAA